MANEFGIFSQLGIDTRSQEEILAEMLAKRQAELSLLGTKGNQAQRVEGTLQRAGAQVGDAVGNRFGGGPQLSPDQQRTVDATKRARDRINQDKAAGKFLNDKGEPDLLLEGEAQQGYLAEELLKAGDMRGVVLLQQLTATKQARDQQDAAIEGLRTGSDARRQQIIESEVRTDGGRISNLRGRREQYWLRGESDPANGFVGVLTEDGTSVIGPNGPVPFSEVTTRPPVDPKTVRSGKVLTPQDYGVGVKEAEGFRTNIDAISRQAEGAVRMKRAMADSIGKDGSLNILDGTGKATAATTTALEFLSGVSRVVEETLRSNKTFEEAGIDEGEFAFVEFGDNSAGRSAALQYVQKNMESLDGKMRDLVPENLRQSAVQRQVYYATLVQMVYARARASEPGARQLSDADFQNAMQGLAGNAADPESFRQVLVGNIISDITHFNDRFMALPDGVRDGGMIVSRAGMERYRRNFDEFLLEFGDSFGTAADPSSALTSAAGAADAALQSEVEAARQRLGIVEEDEPQGAGTADDPIIL